MTTPGGGDLFPDLADPRLVDAQYVDVRFDRFGAPDRSFTGYASDGYWREEGRPNPNVGDYQASWAAEDFGDDRGSSAAFPERLLVLATAKEVAIFNADDSALWMRFRLSAGTSGKGSLLGTADTRVVGARFVHGFLFIATNKGVRIADFVRNRAWFLTADGSGRTANDLDLRNDDPFWVSTSSYGEALLHDEIYDIDVHVSFVTENGVRTARVAVPLGHKNGISVPIFSLDTSASLDLVQHNMSLTRGEWAAVDDGNGDATTPYVYAEGGSWSSIGVETGDQIVLADGEHTIIGRRGAWLEISPETGALDSGTEFVLQRPVRRLHVQDGSLYFSDGGRGICWDSGTSWRSLESSAIYLSSGELQPLCESIRLPFYAGNAQAMTVRGSEILLGNPAGVFSATASLFAEGGTAAFLYASDAYTAADAQYTVLEGGASCTALGVDPATGNLLVATEAGGQTTLTEIEPRRHRPVRSFEDVGDVRVILGYRNGTET